MLPFKDGCPIWFLVAFTSAASPRAQVEPASTELARDLSCFMVMAGKAATANGSVIVAHNNDLTGAETSVVEKIPVADHDEGDVVTFPSGLSIPQAPHTYAMLVLRIHTGFAEGDAIAINEHQVAIGGGVALGGDRNERAARADPLIERGLTGGIRYVALQRSRTARECVEWIGAMYTEHGVTYPSGVAVADPDEVWYIEAGGGRSWAAVRIPDDAVWVQANAYRIGEIDFDDPDNYLAAPNLRDFARRNGLWDPAGGPFHFARAFGGEKDASAKMFRNTRRVWRGVCRLGALDLDPEDPVLPLFVRPAEKVTAQNLLPLLRDHYEGTPYDVHAVGNGDARREYPIATFRSVHTDVVVLRRGLPADVGALMWIGLSSAPTAIYVPFYFGIERVPEPYGVGDAGYDRASAFWTFRSLANTVAPYFSYLIDDVRSVSDPFEREQFSRQAAFESKVLQLHEESPGAARQLLTEYTSEQAMRALQLASELNDRLEVKVARHSHEW